MKILKMLLFLFIIVVIGLGGAVKLFQQSIQPKVAVEDTTEKPIRGQEAAQGCLKRF